MLGKEYVNYKKKNATVYSNVFATNRGGALVRVEGLRGFIPGSHISAKDTKEDLVGQDLPLKFLEVDEERNRLVLSHRRALVERKMNVFRSRTSSNWLCSWY